MLVYLMNNVHVMIYWWITWEWTCLLSYAWGMIMFTWI